MEEIDYVKTIKELEDDNKMLQGRIWLLKGTITNSRNALEYQKSLVKHYQKKLKYLRERIDHMIKHPSSKLPMEAKF